MDRDKLNEAAKREAYNNYGRFYYERRDGFIKGAEWLMTQPLADRLTDEEKEEMIKRYNDELEMARLHTEKMKESTNPSSRQFHANVCEGYISRMKLMKQIFDANFFKEK